MKSTFVLVAPTCACCAEPSPLLPRDDLPGELVVCETSGQLYRPQETGYVPTTLPDFSARERPAASVQIDLSRSGYA
ncbi:MAG: hypothetical protein PVF45_06915 [Anaerolineae bacterium]